MPISTILSEIEARADAATKGPWSKGRDARGSYNLYEMNFNSDVTSPAAQMASEDADFCAASRTDVPRLTAALRKAVNTLEVMGMTETLSHIEKLLGGDNVS